MVEKILIEGYDILENDGQMGIELQLKDAPAETAEFIYDGGSCGILVRNDTKAYIFTNILPELREKLLGSDEIMIIEDDGDEVVNSYMTAVTKVPEIPAADMLPDAVFDMLVDLRDIYGEEGTRIIAEKIWELE